MSEYAREYGSILANFQESPTKEKDRIGPYLLPLNSYFC